MINLGRCRLFAAPAVEVSTRAVDLVLESPVIDMLSLLTLDWPSLYRWQAHPETFGRTDYRKLRSTGIDVFHPAVKPGGVDPYLATEEWIDGWNLLLGSHACSLSPVGSIGALRRAPRLGPIGVVVGFQDSDHLRTVDDVAFFYERGQRVSQLTYNHRNRLGSGCHARPDRGLSTFGGQVVEAMNRVGMAIDVSHCGDRTTLDAVSASTAPVLATHTNCRALVPGQPRCKPDGVIRRLARRGGVLGVTVVRAFVSRRPAPALDDLLDHFDHVARLVGVEHVGLGSDLDADGLDPRTGRPRPPYAIAGLDARARVFQIADGLLGRGYGRDEVELVLGGNFLRALAQIWPDEAPESIAGPPERRDPFCPVPERDLPVRSG